MFASNTEKTKPKILSPVKSYEGAVRVIAAGADELYCGVVNPKIKEFVLYRGPLCEVPSYDEFGQLVKYAHTHGVEVLVTVNRPYMAKPLTKAITSHILSCLDRGADAFIVGDIGIVKLIQEMNLDVPIYASTYMISMNYEAANFLCKQGFSRVILERQLLVDEISQIVQRSKVDIEIFVHGGGCSNINGSCYLYHYNFPALEHAQLMKGGLVRSPCTLPFEIYNLADTQKTLGNIPIMDAFEFCALCQLPKLMNLGVTGFKIEGRGDSVWYQESTTRVYRELVDLLALGKSEVFNERLEQLRDGELIPLPPALPTLREFYCRQKRCYYGPLFHAPYKTPISWQTWTKSKFGYVLSV